MITRVGNPFVGMRAFDYEQRAVFFGREQQAYALYRLMTFGFIAVIGASGSGKSSLVRAGLYPLLYDQSERRPWRIATTTPGGDPLERLTDAVLSFGPVEGNDARTIRRERIAYLLRRSSSGLAEALAEMPDLGDESLLIVIDQFEEIFRSAGHEYRDEAAGFVALLLQLNRLRADAHVLVTMRSDFIGDCAQFAGLPEAVSDTQFLVPSLTRAQREETITKPLALAGATIENTLVERLLNDAGFENDQLPVLQHALTRMWIAAATRDGAFIRITQADYEEAGKLSGAISKHADAVMAELTNRAGAVEAVFRALSERDADGRAIRRARTLREIVAETGLLEDDVRAVIERFRAGDCGFLLPAKGALESEDRVDVVHEALLRRWDRVHSADAARPGWLDREDDDGRYYRSLLIRIDGGETALPVDRVAERYAWWTSKPHTDAWADRYGGRRDRVEQFFADSRAALAAHEDGVIKREQGRRRFIVVVGTVAIVALLLLALTFFALVASERTTNASLVTQSHFLARDARSDNDRGDAADAALLALQALPANLAHPDRPFTWAGYGALTDALANLRERHVYRTNGFYTHARYLPGDRRFVVWQDNGTIQLWSRGKQHPDRAFRAHSVVEKVALSTDGRLLAGGENGGSVSVWALQSPSAKPIMTFPLRAPVVDVAFRSDGRYLLAATAGETSIFDLQTRKRVRSIPAGTNSDETQSVHYGSRVLLFGTKQITLWGRSFSKPEHVFETSSQAGSLSEDDRRCAVAESDGSVTIWDTATMRKLVRLNTTGGSVSNIEFSRDGKTLVTQHEHVLSFWATANGKRLSVLQIPPDFDIASLSFDGKAVAFGDTLGSVQVWSTLQNARLLLLSGFESFILSCGFSRDGSRLIASSDDGTVREFDIRTHVASILNNDAFADNAPDTDAVDVSRDGKWIAIGSQYAVRIYDAVGGRLLRTLRRTKTEAPASRDLGYYYVAFSPDGRKVALSSNAYDGATIWDWKANRISRRIEDNSPLRFLAYSRDGNRLASSEINQAITIHDLRTGASHRLKPYSFEQTVTSLTFAHNDDRIFVTFVGGAVRIYDGGSGSLLNAFRVQQYVVASDVSPDGRLIATASRDKTVQVWNVQNGTLVAVRRSGGFPATAHFSGDSKRLVIAATDRLEIWDIATDRTVLALRGYGLYVDRAEFADGDRRVVSLGIDRTTRLWTLPQFLNCQEALDEARRLVPHGLSPAVTAAEFIAPRRAQSPLASLVPQETCR